ncbi:UDP-glucosyltransferase 2-like [Schistocerca serialis cubense]|uniref:UDP-glucosyltransferase 2-like n=1 Tax=Schistocerca serialis cubense TaxID=2023355 RepID=UPI00214E8F2B|nr:UDP-glucosyltransferase 2-like [Schistocerca serialis cubense]
MRTRPLLLVALLSAAGASEAANILCLVYFVAPSHFVMFERLFKALAARGHNVTVVSHFPQKTPVANYTDISILGSIPFFADEVTMDLVGEYQSLSLAVLNWQENSNFCSRVLSLPQLRALRDTPAHYDLVIAEIFHGDCLVPFAHVFRAPLVGIVSSVAFPWVYDRVGNPDHPAYSECYYAAMTAPFSFLERLENAAWHVALRLGDWWFSQRPIDALARDFFGPDAPAASSVARSSSLVLVNSHHSVNEPRPTVPAIVEVGGLHIKEVQPLPEVRAATELQRFLDGSPQGVVFFSLGTMVRCDTFSPDKMAALLAVFSALPQRVLWRVDPAKLPPLPANVLARKWMPQNDVLNHPNVRLFITHSGLMGTQEALWAGVPMLCMPMFGDQFLNALKVESLGAGIKLEYKDITHQSLTSAMDALLNDPRYRERAKQLSRLFRDRPRPPLEEAVYWVEYVIRHQGAPHLRSAALDLAWYQYLLLDVAAFVIAAASAVTVLTYLVVCRILRLFKIEKSSKHAKKMEKKMNHFNTLGRLVRELSARGHHLTVVSHAPLKVALINYSDISISGSAALVTDMFSFKELSSSIKNDIGLLDMGIKKNLLHPYIAKILKILKLHMNIQPFKTSLEA